MCVPFQLLEAPSPDGALTVIVDEAVEPCGAADAEPVGAKFRK